MPTGGYSQPECQSLRTYGHGYTVVLQSFWIPGTVFYTRSMVAFFGLFYLIFDQYAKVVFPVKSAISLMFWNQRMRISCRDQEEVLKKCSMGIQQSGRSARSRRIEVTPSLSERNIRPIYFEDHYLRCC